MYEINLKINGNGDSNTVPISYNDWGYLYVQETEIICTYYSCYLNYRNGGWYDRYNTYIKDINIVHNMDMNIGFNLLL